MLAFLALPLLATAALARVVNMSAPTTAPAGSNITAVLYTESYIQNWNDFGAIWGLTTLNCTSCEGELVSYDNLYNEPEFPQTDGNGTFTVPLPKLTTGTYTLVAGIPYLVGASGETGINYFKQNITLT